MISGMRRKLLGQEGESIGETLVSLMIAALAMAMLAGALSASLSIIQKSNAKLNEYYALDDGVARRENSSDGSSVQKGGITITDITNNDSVILPQSFEVNYYKNDAFNQKTVISYKLKTP